MQCNKISERYLGSRCEVNEKIDKRVIDNILKKALAKVLFPEIIVSVSTYLMHLYLMQLLLILSILTNLASYNPPFSKALLTDPPNTCALIDTLPLN